MSAFTNDDCDRALGTLHVQVTDRLRIRYEESPPDRRLPYHGVRHTDTVYRTVRQLATAFKLTPRERFVACASALGHDLQMRFCFDRRAIGGAHYAIRKMRIGENERKSAGETIGLARQVAHWITDEHAGEIREAILATIPEWDEELQTLVQPYLRPDLPLHLRLLAFADLNMAGLNSRQFIADGLNVYVETNTGAMECVRSELARSGGPREHVLEPIAEDVRQWLRSQADFARGRQSRFIKDVDGLPLDQQFVLLTRFSRFEDGAAMAEALALESQSLSPHELFGRFLPTLVAIPEMLNLEAA